MKKTLKPAKSRDEFWQKECPSKIASKQQLFITNIKFARLMYLALHQRKEVRKIKSEAILKRFVDEYLKLALKQVADNPVIHNFSTHGVSHIQVLEKDSEKGYDWDREYNGLDYDILMNHDYSYAAVKFDDKFLEPVLANAKQGMRYMREVVNPEKNLKDVTRSLSRRA